jgi:hypothetical protein
MKPGDFLVEQQGMELDYGGAIELMTNSIRLSGGNSFLLKGDIVAHAGDVIVTAKDQLTLGGRVVAGRDASVTVTQGTLLIEPSGGARVASAPNSRPIS